MAEAARVRHVNVHGGDGNDEWSSRRSEDEEEEEGLDMQTDTDDTESADETIDAATHSKDYGLFDQIIRVSTGKYCKSAHLSYLRMLSFLPIPSVPDFAFCHHPPKAPIIPLPPSLQNSGPVSSSLRRNDLT